MDVKRVKNIDKAVFRNAGIDLSERFASIFMRETSVANVHVAGLNHKLSL